MFAYGTVLLCVLAVAGTAWGMTLEGEYGMMWNETENSTMNHTETMNVTMETPVVICNRGYYNPPLCNETCEDNCRAGHDCDPVNGTCYCNSCWDGEYCDNPTGSADCLDEFIRAPEKVNIMCERFGCSIPRVDNPYIEEYLVDLISLRVRNSFIDDSLKYQIINRAETMARTLAKLSFTLNYNQDRPGVETSVENLKTMVKRGTLRCTLAIQNIPTTATSPDTAEITMNI